MLSHFTSLDILDITYTRFRLTEALILDCTQTPFQASLNKHSR